MLVVVTPASITKLAQLDAIKTELELSSTADDFWLNDQIDKASTQILGYLGRVLATETVTETFRPEYSVDALSLARWPVQSITSIVVDGDALATTDYEADLSVGTLWRLTTNDRRKHWAALKTVVTYVAGYKLPGEGARDLPFDIERACIDLVKLRYHARGRDPLLRGQEHDGVGSETYWVGGASDGGAMPPDIRALLDPHREMLVSF